jgi:hypothetical protein
MTINTVRGAQASAIIYSITETARANNLNVYYYISYLLTELPKIINKDGNIEQSKLEPLMPGQRLYRLIVTASVTIKRRLN